MLAQDWTSRVQFTLREPGQRPHCFERGAPGKRLSARHPLSPCRSCVVSACTTGSSPRKTRDADDPLLTDILPRVRINLHEEQKW